METQQQINTSNIKNIDVVFSDLSYDKKILYIYAIDIRKYGNIPLKRMINGWLNNNFDELDNFDGSDDFEKYFLNIYKEKLSQTRNYWTDSKIKSIQLCFKQIFPPTEDKTLLEMEILKEAISLFKKKNKLKN